jgi:DNA polymerase I-like protein with 3'-5' exonuclease and polymerase domains
MLKMFGAHVLLLVHDSIIFEYPDNPALEEAAITLVQDTMVATASGLFPEVPWRAEAECGYNWGEVKAYEAILPAGH